MEERNLELDDDGKIKLKKNREDFLSETPSDEGDDIVIEVPDFESFREEDGRVGLSDEELAAKAKEREERAATKKETAEKLLEEADALFDAGDFVGAGEKYLDSAAEYAADWRPWFGVVKVQTKDFTDFHDVYDCQKAYERAFRRMSEQDRASLSEKYLPSMEGMIAKNAEEADRLMREDEAERAAAREGLRAESKSRTVGMIVFVALFAAFAVAGGVLAAFISSVKGMQILIPAIVCIAAAVVLLFFAAWAVKRCIFARLALSANLRAGTTAAGKKAAELTEYGELMQSIADNFRYGLNENGQ